MADRFALHYQSENVVFEKSQNLIAARARAGMADAMQADVDKIAVNKDSAQHRTMGAFGLIELRRSAAGLERDLDWLRARPSVAAASHVFMMQGKTALMVPDGHVQLLFNNSVPGHLEHALLMRYRLQVIEQRGHGDYLVRITSGSKNPLATAVALQAEPDVALAEPEFIDAG